MIPNLFLYPIRKKRMIAKIKGIALNLLNESQRDGCEGASPLHNKEVLIILVDRATLWRLGHN